MALDPKDSLQLGGSAGGDILSVMLGDHGSENPKAYFNKNIVYADAEAILVGAA